MTHWADLNRSYGTIVADPPWSYNKDRAIQPRTRTGKTRIRPPGVSAQYSMMTMAELVDLPVADLAAPDAHLYLWATNPTLFGDRNPPGPGPVDILEAWGFRYVTLLTWEKQGHLGLGFHFRGMTEHILFGVRGRASIPPGKRERNIFAAPKRGHSEKPAALGDLAERVSPGPYLELFARQPRLGWDSWGRGYEGISQMAT